MHHLLGKWDYNTLTDVMALGPDFIPKPARTVALLFQQPSTRTHLSFLTAVHSLCYTPLDLGSTTSMEKGESLADTLAVIAAMGIDLAVVRTCEDLAHTMRGWPETACPVINAGDAHWHPTQALVDAYTLCQHFGSVDLTGKTVGIIGDWRSRVAPSTEQALELLGAQVLRTGPNGWGRKQGLGQTMKWVMDRVDAFEVMRPQVRHVQPGGYGITAEDYEPYRMTAAKAEGRPVMHPGPITPDRFEIDDDCIGPIILQQVANGVKMRTALLTYFL